MGGLLCCPRSKRGASFRHLGHLPPCNTVCHFLDCFPLGFLDPVPDAFKVGRRFFINKPVKSSQLVFEKKRCLPFLSQDGVWCTDGEGTQSYQGPKGVRGERAGATVASRDPTERTCAMAAAICPPKAPKSTYNTSKAVKTKTRALDSGKSPGFRI